MSALVPPRVDSVPSCSRYSAADYDESRAAAFDPRDPTYLQVQSAPSSLGCPVLGILGVGRSHPSILQPAAVIGLVAVSAPAGREFLT